MNNLRFFPVSHFPCQADTHPVNTKKKTLFCPNEIEINPIALNNICMNLFKFKITITHYDAGTKNINFTKHQEGKC